MLCVVGMPGCGKSSFLGAAEEFNYPIVSMGNAVRAETKKRGLPPERHGEVAEQLRGERGLAAVAHLILDKVTPTSIIDGVRGLEEVNLFNEHYSTEIVAIHASPKTRFRRLIKRHRPGDPVTWREFTERDMRELTFGIGNVIALADYVLVNEATKHLFEARCRAFLKKWRI